VSMLLDAPVLASVKTSKRPCVQGKFIFCGNEKLYIRGVTYGPFRPDAEGGEYHSPDVVERDFAQMAANGLNAVRTYTVPLRGIEQPARRHGLRVMVSSDKTVGRRGRE
jgi:O-antigen biosynthesis protein